MGSDGKVRLPSSGGGIMQYYDEYSSKFTISPNAVIILTIIFTILIIALNIAVKGTAS